MKSLFKFICIFILTLITFWGCSVVQPNQNEQIKQIAKSITVRLYIPSTNISGSGVIIKKTKDGYLILTNEHVIEASPKQEIWVQTPDDENYKVTILEYPFVKDDDLAVVKLITNKQYSIALAGDSSKVKIGDILYSVGFPFDAENPEILLKVTKGVYSMITKPLVGGYQLGYSNDVYRGMSGGPILNEQGEVIGVNGISKNPSLGDPFQFIDDSVIPDETWKQMSELSWGIPIERFTKIQDSFLRL